MAVFSCHGRTILFVHVPKCAGTSVTAMMERLGDKRFDARMQIGRHWVRPRHMARDTLEQVYFPEMFDYAFMLVRNPVARIISEYRYQTRKSFPRWQAMIGFDRWLDHSLRRAASNPFYRESHFRPQTDFRVFGCDVFRIEDGPAQLIEKLKAVTLAEFPPAPQHLNRSEARDIRMSRESLAKIKATYAEDFSAFGYRTAECDYDHLLK
jgi:hypothetical protein